MGISFDRVEVASGMVVQCDYKTNKDVLRRENDLSLTFFFF